MPDLEITEYSDYETFAQEWQGDSNESDTTETRLRWQLLGQLGEDELLIQLPEWLAEEKVGYVDSGTPIEFVGRIDRESEKAIRLADSAAAPPLMQLAHRIYKLEEGLENAAADESRHDWLENRLQAKQQEFEQREDVPKLSEEWIPKSQVESAVRRVT
ncbi:hypothetical protein [Natrinema gelatinilyticum]|uniref:hypothetical protein n=1 Tax=Natrinema gelatinilyticum TaxID=2961571 RepID=UPI0020C37428|nr:hypothetical protein [Natrinema gelatinilyticum]